ncbi:Lysophospholipase L1 [Frankineae bacterium MT45]|nr:Lysophospholipase L1 [Frankineae bacterium MT45]
MSGRPTGPFLTAASRLLPGVRTVQGQVAPFAAYWEQQNRAVLADGVETPLWVALGDSMTQGIGAPGPGQGWVGQAQRLLEDAGESYRVVNLSMSGGRVEDVLRRQLPALQGLQQQGIDPALVTVLIGSNDLVRRRYRDALPAGFAELLRALPKGSVVSNLPNPRRAANEIDRLIREGAAAGQLALADMRQPRTTRWRGKLAADHFHPNERGYAAIAQIFFEAIRTRRSAD